jgi:hypothetical protein
MWLHIVGFAQAIDALFVISFRFRVDKLYWLVLPVVQTKLSPFKGGQFIPIIGSCEHNYSFPYSLFNEAVAMASRRYASASVYLTNLFVDLTAAYHDLKVRR